MSRAWNRLKTLVRHGDKERELEQELSAHLRMDADERMESGVPADEARRAAQRAFGSVLRAAEDTRAAWGWTTLEQWLQDVRWGARTLWSRPVFTIIAVSTLALGIGATTAIFSILNAALLRPLPYPDPDRLVAVSSINQRQERAPALVAPADYVDWREQSHSFEQLAAYSGADLMSLSLGDRLEPVPIARVTWNFFQTFGVQPMRGSGFAQADEKSPVQGLTSIVLSHRMWQSRFGGDPAVVGTRIRTASGSAVISGVMPPEFRFPEYADMWIPIGCCGEMTRRGTRYWRVVGRLDSDQTVDASQEELAVVASQLANAYPKENRNWSVEVTPFARALVRDVQRPLWTLMGAVVFVIVIACANVAGLTLARSASRRRELAVRVALGASRTRLIRQLFVEGLLVSLAGAAAGLLVARWSIAAFFSPLPQTAWTPLSRFRDAVQLDATVLLVAVLLSTLTAVVLTLTPVLDALKRALGESVRSWPGTIVARREHRVYRLLVAGQFACAIVLLAGAGLLMQSFVRMLTVERGYDPSGVMIMGLPLPARNQQVFIDEALERVRSAAGVESVAVMSAPRFGQLNFPINVAERPLPDGDVVVRYSSVTADYLRVLRARLLAGRTFDVHDDANARRVVMINDTLARQYFSGEDPVDRRIVLVYNNQRVPLEIVGIVADIRQDAPGEPVRPEVLVHWPQAPWLAATLVVRAGGDPAAVQHAVRAALWSVDRSLPAYPSLTLDDILQAQVATPRLYMVLFGVFSGAAVILAALGIYGLFAYIVGRRTNEIAVRVAIGGQRSRILGMIIGEGLRLSLVGIGAGLLGTIALTRLMRGLLFEVSANDPVTFGGVAVLLCAVALAACYLPARRAANTDPIVALRYE